MYVGRPTHSHTQRRRAAWRRTCCRHDGDGLVKHTYACCYRELATCYSSFQTYCDGATLGHCCSAAAGASQQSPDPPPPPVRITMASGKPMAAAACKLLCDALHIERISNSLRRRQKSPLQSRSGHRSGRLSTTLY